MGACNSLMNKYTDENRGYYNMNMSQSMVNNGYSIISNKININFRCTYEIKDKDINNYIQIINNRNGKYINNEIEAKIKILNNGEKEPLIFKKKFASEGINVIDFIIEGKLNNLSFMFNQCTTLKSIDFIDFETEQVTNMTAMFQTCKELKHLDLSNFNTSNVTDMGWMFNECYKLQEIKGIKNFNTCKVTKMNSMFQECNELKCLDLTHFDTSNVTDMGWMFNKCRSLEEIKGINTFNTFKVTNMRIMFQACNTLPILDLSNFNTSNVSDMGWMFNKCRQLQVIIGINNFITCKVTKMNSMFQECYELEDLDLSNFDTSNVTDMGWMFNKCHKLKIIKGIDNFNIFHLTNLTGIFDECYELEFSKMFSKFSIGNIHTNNNLPGIILQLNEEKEYNKKLKKEIDNMFAVNFVSTDYNINNCPLVCKKTEYFIELEEKLYKEYPYLKRKSIYFLCNGNLINRDETLENNGIKKGNIILKNKND